MLMLAAREERAIELRAFCAIIFNVWYLGFTSVLHKRLSIVTRKWTVGPWTKNRRRHRILASKFVGLQYYRHVGLLLDSKGINFEIILHSTLTFFVLPHLPTVHTVGCHCYLLITFYCARTEIIILFHGMRANGPSHYLKCSECKFVI